MSGFNPNCGIFKNLPVKLIVHTHPHNHCSLCWRPLTVLQKYRVPKKHQTKSFFESWSNVMFYRNVYINSKEMNIFHSLLVSKRKIELFLYLYSITRSCFILQCSVRPVYRSLWQLNIHCVSHHNMTKATTTN